MKTDEKDVRLRYVRGLERFASSNISYLKESAFEFDVFQKRVKKRFEILEKIEAIRLNSAYPIALESYANLLLSALHVEEFSKEQKEELRDRLLKEANLLHKERNKTLYKKDKHKKSSFSDGY